MGEVSAPFTRIKEVRTQSHHPLITAVTPPQPHGYCPSVPPDPLPHPPSSHPPPPTSYAWALSPTTLPAARLARLRLAPSSPSSTMKSPISSSSRNGSSSPPPPPSPPPRSPPPAPPLRPRSRSSLPPRRCGLSPLRPPRRPPDLPPASVAGVPRPTRSSSASSSSSSALETSGKAVEVGMQGKGSQPRMDYYAPPSTPPPAPWDNHAPSSPPQPRRSPSPPNRSARISAASVACLPSPARLSRLRSSGRRTCEFRGEGLRAGYTGA